jgi:phosphoribosylformylglycinamidine (FGAM) synthase-like enzyme
MHARMVQSVKTLIVRQSIRIVEKESVETSIVVGGTDVSFYILYHRKTNAELEIYVAFGNARNVTQKVVQKIVFLVSNAITTPVNACIRLTDNCVRTAWSVVNSIVN